MEKEIAKIKEEELEAVRLERQLEEEGEDDEESDEAGEIKIENTRSPGKASGFAIRDFHKVSDMKRQLSLSRKSGEKESEPPRSSPRTKNYGDSDAVPTNPTSRIRPTPRQPPSMFPPVRDPLRNNSKYSAGLVSVSLTF